MSEIPTARVRKSRGFALIWLVPIAALGLVIWLGARNLVERGPQVTITFATAEGIEAGHTKVRYKSVDVGQVENVTLADGMSHVVITARIDSSAAAGLTGDAMFWVVRPRLSPAGISGLNTIVSGSYVELRPGRPGTPQYEFKGLEDPPLGDPEQPGRRFLLHAERQGGAGQGSPIYHRGVTVGEVLGTQLTASGDGVDIQAFIRAPYAELIHPRTRFWNVSGISISAGPQGVKADMESLQALVSGGIEFDTEKEGAAAPSSPAGAEFRLFDDSGQAQTEPWGPTARFLVDFLDPAHGLADGAPVELQGRPIGKVVEVHLAYDAGKAALSTPAVIEIAPEKIVGFAVPPDQNAAVVATDTFIRQLVGQGLRAHLASVNLLTGQRMVALSVDTDVPKATLRQGGAYPEIPAAEADDFEGLTRSASHALDAVAAMPLKAIGDNLRDVLNHLDSLVGSPDAKQSLHSLNETLAHADKVAADAETSVPALVKSLNETADATTRTLDVLGGQAGRGTDLRGLLHEMQEAARSLRALSDFLQEHPEALVKGRNGEAK